MKCNEVPKQQGKTEYAEICQTLPSMQCSDVLRQMGKNIPRELSVDVPSKSCARDGAIYIEKVPYRNITMEVVLDEHVFLERPQNFTISILEKFQQEEDQDKHGRGTRLKMHKFIGGGSVAAGGLALQDQNENVVDLDIEDGEDVEEVTEVAGEEEITEPPAKKLKVDKAAPVWKFATRVNSEKAKCNLCKKDYKTPQGNTSNIRDHIIMVHSKSDEGRELKEITEEKRTAAIKKDQLKEKRSITSFFPSDKQVSMANKATIDNAVVEFIIAGNQSFSVVDNCFFRKMCFSLNRGYTLFSRRELGRLIDEKVESVKADLTKELQEDIKSHKSIHITSDGGNSGDQNKTKKNTLTVSRINDNFEMKTDTLDLAEAVGSQTGIVIRSQKKDILLKYGYNESWKVSVTTDAAANVRSARQVGRHEGIGLPVKFEADCCDHQIQLVGKDSLKNSDLLKESLKKGRKLIAHFSKSTLSRQLLVTIQKELNLQVKWILVGTKNRWFHQMSEAERLVELRVSIEEFQMRRRPGDGRRTGDEDDDVDEDLVVPEQLDSDDFLRLEKYVAAMKPFTAISKFLGGDKYPTGGCVIPALEQIKEDLEVLRDDEKDDEAKKYLENLLTSMEKRFRNNWKMKSPYNCLTFLDPRHVDLYCLEDAVFDKLKNDIIYDSVFEEDAANHPLPEANPTGSLSATPTVLDKRAKLLQKKMSRLPQQPQVNTFEGKLMAEIARLTNRS